MSPLEPHLVYADENYAIFFKPSGMPSAPLHEGDKDNALYYAAEYYPSVLTITSKYKEIEKGLIHRIDTSTSGLILLAGNQNSYNNLIQQQTDNEFVKFYSAYVRKTAESDIFFKEKKGFPFCPYNFNKLPLVIRSSF
ncbi:MAG TPA: pseudouridine synthase, partial [Treponemataceae bacterium]|nr:pseudouridine synthase [Treponemataceae bacterium]